MIKTVAFQFRQYLSGTGHLSFLEFVRQAFMHLHFHPFIISLLSLQSSSHPLNTPLTPETLPRLLVAHTSREIL